jgi:phospholipid transport system transporter-binding protein
VTLRREGEKLMIDGAVTLDTVPGLISAAEEHFRQGADVVDFEAVTEVDSAAVALALEWVRQAERANVALRLVNLPASMQNLAKLYGVSELLQPANA